MKNRMTRTSAVVLGLLGAGAASGATMFTEDFSDNSAGPNMALGTPVGTTTTDFTGDFTITSGAGGRIYLGTNDADYSTTSFVFEADVTVPNTADAWAITFFGMGTANAGGTASTPPYGEPVTVPTALMVLRNDGPNPGRGIEQRANNSTTTLVHANIAIKGATHGMRLTWDADTKMATFEYDHENDGIYNGVSDKSFTLDASGYGFDGTNSQLLLGGGNGLTFDNISVTAVPEPGSLALIGLGALGMLRRRRH